MVKLICKLGVGDKKVVEVNPSDPLYIPFQKLKISDKQFKFLFNGKAYSMASIQTFEEIGLTFNTRIDFLNKAVSGGGMTFTDVSKKNTVNLGFSSSAPSYRTANKGINIFGFCKKSGCNAYDKEVVVPISKNKVDLIEKKFSFHCPECDSIIEPKTVGFYLCKYHIYGNKLDDKKLVDFDNGYEEARDKEHLQYFDSDSNKYAFFFKLIFEIIEYY